MNNKLDNTIRYLLLLSFLAICVAGSVISMNPDATASFTVVINVIFFSLLLLAITVDTNLIKMIIKLKGIGVWFLFLTFYFLFFTFFEVKHLSLRDYVLSFSYFCLPLVTYFLFMFLLFNSRVTEGGLSKIFFVILFLFFLIASYDVFTKFNNDGYITPSNWANIIISSAPFALISKNRVVNLTVWLLLVATVFLFMKRSSFVIIGLTVFGAFYFRLFVNFTLFKALKKVVLTALSVGVLFYLINSLQLELFLSVAERLGSSVQDGGSGRTDIWSFLLNDYLERDFLGLLFGDLSNSKSTLDNIGFHSPHNDFISFLVSYGIVGVSLLLFFYFKVVCSSFRFLKSTGFEKNISIILFLASLTFYMLLSGIFSFPLMFLGVFLFMAYIDFKTYSGRNKTD